MPAILCPNCHKLISNDATQCPFCGQVRPGLWGFTSAMRKLGLQLDFTRLILWVCIGLYILALLLDPGAIFETGGMMNLLAPSVQASFMLGMTGADPVFRLGHWWTLITAMYLHGGLLHIFFNMMWVRQLAPLVEELFGPFRLFTIFTVAGFFGFLISSFMGNAYTLGASGSIFGLLAAAVVYGRQQGSSLFTRQFLQWAVILFVFGLVFPGVDNLAHLGGFVGGYGMAYLFSKVQGREGLGAYVGAGLCLVLTLLAFALQALTAVSMW
jgi:rhomboid protease GluP